MPDATGGYKRLWAHLTPSATLQVVILHGMDGMSDPLRSMLAERGVLLADGATGTSLFALGLATGEAPEIWNLEEPEKIRAHYRSFVDAGSDIFLTNTFGGTSYRLKLHDFQDRVTEINEAGARLGREVADAADRRVLVGGSMGPTGELFEPMGALTHAACEAAFREQAEALARGGADVLWIETLSAQEEVDAAIAAARSTGLPVVCTVSFDTNGRTMMGITPERFARHCRYELAEGPDAFGSNCGTGAAELVAAVVNMRAAVDDDAIVVAKANCGIPEWHGSELTYNGTPELMADYAVLVRDAGANIIGGCCGTTAEHIRRMRTTLDETPPGATPDAETIVRRLGEVSGGAEKQLAGEAEAADTGGGRGGRRRRRERG